MNYHDYSSISILNFEWFLPSLFIIISFFLETHVNELEDQNPLQVLWFLERLFIFAKFYFVWCWAFINSNLLTFAWHQLCHCICLVSMPIKLSCCKILIHYYDYKFASKILFEKSVQIGDGTRRYIFWKKIRIRDNLITIVLISASIVILSRMRRIVTIKVRVKTLRRRIMMSTMIHMHRRWLCGR